MTSQPVLPQPQPVRSKDVRRAWIATALIPVGIAAAIVVGTAIASALGYDSGSGDLAPLGIALAAGVPGVLVGLLPGFAVFFGLRARRAGDIGLEWSDSSFRLRPPRPCTPAAVNPSASNATVPPSWCPRATP